MKNPCNTCPVPGHCCKEFSISCERTDGKMHAFQENEGAKLVDDWLKEKGLPFVRTRAADGYWLFDCTKLTEAGRCSDYANRPDICKEYKPGTDGLCVLHKEAKDGRKK